MPQKKEPLPVKVDVDLQNGGTITYANEVIATIAGVATNEIDGVAGMCVSGGFGEILSRNRNITRGVKVEVGSQEAAVDLYIIVEYGTPIQEVCAQVQENVRKALESLTGLRVVRVDVHVQGVSFERDKKATQSSIEAAKQPVLEEPKKAPEQPEEPAAAPEYTQPEPAEAAAEPEKMQEETPVETPAPDAPADEQSAPAPVAEEPAAEESPAAPADEQPADAAPAQEEPKPAPKRRRKKTEPAGSAAPENEAKPAKGPGGRKRA